MATQAQKDYFENISKDTVVIDTLELSHSKFTTIYRICRDKKDNDFRLEDGTIQTFKSVNLTLSTPKFNNEVNNVLNFSIDIINFEIVQSLDNILKDFNDEKIKIVYRTYEKNNKNYPVIGPLIFETSAFQIKKNSLTISAKTHEFVNLKWPNLRFTKELFPGIVYV